MRTIPELPFYTSSQPDEEFELPNSLIVGKTETHSNGSLVEEAAAHEKQVRSRAYSTSTSAEEAAAEVAHVRARAGEELAVAESLAVEEMASQMASHSAKEAIAEEVLPYVYLLKSLQRALLTTFHGSLFICSFFCLFSLSRLFLYRIQKSDTFLFVVFRPDHLY